MAHLSSKLVWGVDGDSCLKSKCVLKTTASPPPQPETLETLKKSQPACNSSVKALNSLFGIQVSVRKRKSSSWEEKNSFEIKVLFATDLALINQNLVSCVASGYLVAVVRSASAVVFIPDREAESLGCCFQANLRSAWINLIPIMSGDHKTVLS